MNKTCWAIFIGKTILLHTIRSTKKQCISDREREMQRPLLAQESCEKVKVVSFDRCVL